MWRGVWRRPMRRTALGGGIALAIVLALGTSVSAKSCRMKAPDLSVYVVKLVDAESAAQKVGSGAKLEDDSDDLPHARFVSSNGVEELILFSHYGADPDEYAEVEVRLAGEEALALPELKVDAFVSEHGIALGMTPAEVEKRFGPCIKSRDDSGASEVIQYEIADADRDDELKSYGYPSYYAEYEFERGKLIRYRFGFEYP